MIVKNPIYTLKIFRRNASTLWKREKDRGSIISRKKNGFTLDERLLRALSVLLVNNTGAITHQANPLHDGLTRRFKPKVGFKFNGFTTG